MTAVGVFLVVPVRSRTRRISGSEKKGELYPVTAVLQAERGRGEGHPHVEGKEHPAPEVSHGEAQR
jgi:hypothetical protein